MSDYIDDFIAIEVSEIDDQGLKVSDNDELKLSVGISNELELDFLMSLMENDDCEDCIEVVVPIEDLLKPIGLMRMNFENLIKIRSYNPRIKICILHRNEEIEITDEQLLVI